MIRPAVRHIGRMLLLFACWTLWILLAAALGLQIFVATHHEMAVPQPVLTALERRLSFAGLRADFGRTRLDPTGRILMEDVRVRFQGFEEPILVAQVVSARLGLLALLTGRIEAGEIRVSGLSLRVPAMFSPSGTSDEVLSDMDIDLVPRGERLRVPYFSARAGVVEVAGSADLLLGSGSAPGAALPAPPLLARQYAGWTRMAASWLAALSAVERPVLRLRLESNPDRSLGVAATACADAVRLPGAAQVRAYGVRAEGRWRFHSPDTSIALDFEAARLVLPRVADARGVLGTAEVVPGNGGGWPVTVRRVAIAARSLYGSGIPAATPFGRFDVAGYPAVSGAVHALVWGQPVALTGTANAATRVADVNFRARIDPAARSFLETHRFKGISRYLDWEQPIAAEGECRFGPGGHFQSAWARVAIHGLVARTVRIDEAGGRIEFDGSRLLAPHAFARIGADVAAGSFAQDRAGNYRFLLRGRLRPLDISPWIAGDWWPDFFGNFAFPAAPPAADIDLRGCWTDSNKAEVFLRVDAPGARFKGLDFDDLAGRIFVRPQFVDALEFAARRGDGAATGRFSRTYSFAANDWSRIDLQVRSTLAPAPILKLLGTDGQAVAAGFDFPVPPQVQVSGFFTGPGDPAGSHRRLFIRMRSDRPLAFHRLPLDAATLDARLDDDDLAVENVRADIAGGRAEGSGELSGPAAARRLKFTVTLSDVSLPRAVSAVAGLAGKANPAAGKGAVSRVIGPKADVRVNANASAQGDFGDPYSFHGSGTIDLRGREVGELRMLGLLSSLLRFTALRFTAASAQFIIDGSQVIFPDITVTGANSAITAKGTCGLENGELDIRAKLNPFKESHALPQRFMDLVLTPVSDALEVRLIGTLAKPDWVFVNGPGNFLRNPAPGNGVAPIH